MPLTEFQRAVARLLAANRTEDSHLAGGAALHAGPNTTRYSNDLDYFHDSEQRVVTAFAADRDALEAASFRITILLQQPGFVRALVARNGDTTKVEWAHESSFRFFPVLTDADLGTILHPVDLATNKVLALVGRDEPRDLIDVLHADEQILPLGALVWAATGKDPGYTPTLVLDMLRRRGKLQQADLDRLRLARPMSLTEVKRAWLGALEEATAFVASRPPDDIGCLYLDAAGHAVAPVPGQSAQRHFGRPGGVVPRIDP